MTKVTIEELNNAYEEVKKIAETKQTSLIEIVVSRDPLIRHNLLRLYNEKEEFPIVTVLKFEFDYSIGISGRWICSTDIEVIDLD